MRRTALAQLLYCNKYHFGRRSLTFFFGLAFFAVAVVAQRWCPMLRWSLRCRRFFTSDVAQRGYSELPPWKWHPRDRLRVPLNISQPAPIGLFPITFSTVTRPSKHLSIYYIYNRYAHLHWCLFTRRIWRHSSPTHRHLGIPGKAFEYRRHELMVRHGWWKAQ